MENRRSFLIGAAASLLAAPAIVHASSLMPIRGLIMDVKPVEIVYSGLFRFVAIYDAAEPFQFGGFFDYGKNVQMIDGDTFTLHLENGDKIPFKHDQKSAEHKGKRYTLGDVQPPMIQFDARHFKLA